jgi:hypothetical protein
MTLKRKYHKIIHKFCITKIVPQRWGKHIYIYIVHSTCNIVTIRFKDLTCREGGYGFLFRSEMFFRTTRELEYFFSPEFNIRLYVKNSESDYLFFFSSKIRIFNILKQNRKCHLCNLEIGNEFHYLFICSYPRIFFIPEYYLRNPSLYKLKGMLSLCNVTVSVVFF